MVEITDARQAGTVYVLFLTIVLLFSVLAAAQNVTRTQRSSYHRAIACRRLYILTGFLLVMVSACIFNGSYAFSEFFRWTLPRETDPPLQVAQWMRNLGALVALYGATKETFGLWLTGFVAIGGGLVAFGA